MLVFKVILEIYWIVSRACFLGTPNSMTNCPTHNEPQYLHIELKMQKKIPAICCSPRRLSSKYIPAGAPPTPLCQLFPPSRQS